jgi:hypothetical protein
MTAKQSTLSGTGRLGCCVSLQLSMLSCVHSHSKNCYEVSLKPIFANNSALHVMPCHPKWGMGAGATLAFPPPCAPFPFFYIVWSPERTTKNHYCVAGVRKLCDFATPSSVTRRRGQGGIPASSLPGTLDRYMSAAVSELDDK